MISKLKALFSSSSALVVLAVVFVYLVSTYLPRLLPSSAGTSLFLAYATTYVPDSLLWGGTAYLVYRLGPVRTGGKPRLRAFVNLLGLVCGSIYLLVTFLSGMVFGFDKSPASFTPLGIVTNIVFLGTGVLGQEMARSRLVNSAGRKKLTQAFVGVTLLLTLVNFPLLQLAAVGHSRTQLIEFMSSSVLPALATNVLACYLVLLGGPFPAIIYRGMQNAFQWFSPVLPATTWTSGALIGIFLPVFSGFLVRLLYKSEAREKTRDRHEQESALGWVVTGFISLSMIWFAVGLFPVYPSVIVSGSMEPTIMIGDVVLIHKVPAADIKVGNIAQYRSGPIIINHRVIAIEGTGKDEIFIFKGDNNPSADDPVSPSQIIGKEVALIPKVGLLTMALRKPGGESLGERH